MMSQSGSQVNIKHQMSHYDFFKSKKTPLSLVRLILVNT
ncbi:hypothetical protein FM109_01260 [Vibrio casei]|nr:hypothetical protein FM109_01260 [Vibrio casei]